MWSDDPVRDAQEWSAEGERKEALWNSCNAECMECGKTIKTEMCVVLNPLDAMESALCVDCEKKAVEAITNAGMKELAWWFHDWLTDNRMDTPRDSEKARELGFNE